MPLLARWFVKTALVYLAAALLTGLAIAAGPLWGSRMLPAALWTSYVHLFVVGWLTQLIFGVALWLFPRYSKELPHGRTSLAWATYVLLNIGLIGRLVTEPAIFWSTAPAWRWGLVVASVLQWLAVAIYVVFIWSRVRTK
ncbi:MAG TPA: hypothetical protein VF190_03100 [Rhodothermales bacterium]